MNRIVEGEYQPTPKKHVIRFDAKDEKSPVKSIYIKTEAVQDYIKNRSSVRIAVDIE